MPEASSKDGRSSPQILALPDKNDEQIKNPLCYCGRTKWREGILRSLLLIPIIAWFFIIDPIEIATGASLALFGLYVLWLSHCEKKD